jgi:hypothetical protein
VAHVVPEDGIFMAKHVGVMSVLLNVYDIVSLVACNKIIY